jgi:hypothetical protein
MAKQGLMRLISVYATSGTANYGHIPEIPCQPFVKSGERACAGHGRQCQNVVIIGYAVAASVKTDLFSSKSVRIGRSEPTRLV